MTTRFNIALCDYINQGGSLKKALHDSVIMFYSGSLPASADLPMTGTLLGIATLQGGALTPGVKSVRQVDQTAITVGNTGDAYNIVINGTIYSYVQQVADTAAIIATALAALVENDPAVEAIADGNLIITRARFGGVLYTIANTNSTHTANVVLTNLVANSRLNGLQWGSSSGGIITKEAGTWAFTAMNSGVAPGTTIGCARICASNDANGSSPSTPRIDMDCSQSGSA